MSMIYMIHPRHYTLHITPVKPGKYWGFSIAGTEASDLTPALPRAP